MDNWKDYLTIQNIVVAILVIIGLIWLISSLWMNMKVNRIAKWPVANATVVNSVIEPEKVTSTFGSSYLDPRYLNLSTDVSTKFIPRILYRYTINGQEYQSTNVVYGGDKSYNALDIKTLMGNIGPGSVIQVYYNQSNPSESYIFNGTTSYMGVILGLLLLAVAGAIGYHHNVMQKGKTVYGTPTMDSYTPRLTTDERPIRNNDRNRPLQTTTVKTQTLRFNRAPTNTTREFY